MGIFIKVEVDESHCEPEQGARLVQVCPVNIFRLEGGRVVTDPDNEDECTLCELCLKICSPGAVTIRRLYLEEGGYL